MGQIVSWVAHGFRQRGTGLSPRAVGLLLALLLLIALLAAARLVLISKVAAAARDLQEMRRDLSGLQQENADLEVEIAGWRSVEGLLDRARELDLEHAEEIRFVEP